MGKNNIDTDSGNQKRILNKAYKYMALLLVFFLVTALLGVVLGRFVDGYLGIAPYGTLGVLAVFYIVSLISGGFLVKRLTNK